MNLKNLVVLGTALAFNISAYAQTCGSNSPATEPPARGKEAAKDIVDTAIAAGQFETLVAAVKAADLVETLKGSGPFTVFAPTDEAFAKLGKATLDNLLKPENKGKLSSILTYHVVSGKVLAEDVVKLTSAATVNGQRVEVKVKDKTVMIDNAKVVKTDILCSNGVIHVIDAVILPVSDNIVEVAGKAKTFNTLLAAAKAAGLADTLAKDGPFTVFAPTDEAFAKLGQKTLDDLLKPENKDKLANILKYHVVSGRVYSDAALKAGKAKTLAGQELRIKSENGKAYADSAGIVTTDLDAANGVIHVIDTVLLPK